MTAFLKRARERGAALMLIAVGLTAGMGAYVAVTQVTSQMMNRDFRHFSNAIDGFYWPEMALVQADYLDQKAIADAAAAGTVPAERKKHKTRFLRRVVRETVNTSEQLLEPLSLKSNVDENLSFSIPGGLPPKEICGELNSGKNGYRVCAYRTPALDPTGIPADVLACARKWSAGGPLPFTQAQLQNPRRVTLGNAYVAIGAYADTTPTAAPDLLVISIPALVSALVNLTLTNPNGWYCVNMGNWIRVSNAAQIDCHAHFATTDTRLLYDLYPRTSIVGSCN